MKAITKSIRSSVTMIMLTFIFPIFIFAQSRFEPNHSKEIVPHVRDQHATSKVIGNQRVEDGTGIVRAIYNPNFAVHQDEPERMAKQYLNAFANSFVLKSNINDLEHERTIETPGGFKVQFKQKAAGYPVYGSEIKVSINNQNKVVFVTNSYKPIGDLQKEINISSDAATLASINHIGVSGRLSLEKIETVVYNINLFKSVIAYKVNLIPAEDHFGDWELIVDAGTGEILRAENKACSHHPDGVKYNGSGWVFDPDPISSASAVYGTNGFIDNNDADSDSLTAQLIEVELEDITFEEAENVYSLKGPYAEIVDVEAPFKGLFKQPESSFFYTRSSDNFEAVNCYYHIHNSMKYLNEVLGFNIMPYQYTGGVQFDPHGLNGADNSHYLPGSGQITFGEGGVDDAEDFAVILHELGHGIHDWVGSISQVDGLSEGLSDYWTSSYLRSLGYWNVSDDEYNWVFHWVGHNEFWEGRRSDVSGHYPEALSGSVHADGQLWASSLMQIYDLIGKEATDVNCWEGISMLSGNSGQVDAAYAFSQADKDIYDGEHLGDIYDVFYERGYLSGPISPSFTADQPNGEGPLDVVFTDASVAFFTDIVSWEWDFNNDGEIDSYDQNPTFTFTEVGAYTISLTVSDGEYTETLVKENYVTVNGGFFVFETNENQVDHSGAFIRDFMEARGFEVVYSNYFPTSFDGFDAVFLSFGNIGEGVDKGTLLQHSHTLGIQNYLEQGGVLYTEGSAFLSVPGYFGFPNADEFIKLFGVESINLTYSGNPISKLQGFEGSIHDGMIFNESNQQFNWYIDKVFPEEGATASFYEEDYGNVSIYNDGEYGQKTFHFAYSLAELVDEDPMNSRNNILLKVLEFFEMLPEGYVVSNFTSDKNAGGDPLEIQFTDFSLSDPSTPILSWEWDFNNDGEIDSYNQNPTWTFSDPGEYDITLITTNNLQPDTLTKHSFITVNHGLLVYEGRFEGEGYSGTFIRDYLEGNSIFNVNYRNKFPDDFEGYEAVFLSFGHFHTVNTILNDNMAAIIMSYIEGGGSVYLDGGDAIYYQGNNVEFLEVFGLESNVYPANNPIDYLAGQPDALTSGLVFTSSSQVAVTYVNIYVPNESGIVAFEESDYGIVAVQNTGGYSQRTFCFSYTLADLDDGESPNTRDELLGKICDFFDINVAVYSPVEVKFELEIYPNPTNQKSMIEFNLEQTEMVSIIIYNAMGQEITNLISEHLNAGNHKIEWNTKGLNEGIYFCTLKTNQANTSKKIIKLN